LLEFGNINALIFFFVKAGNCQLVTWWCLFSWFTFQIGLKKSDAGLCDYNVLLLTKIIFMSK
jgi:hypothetical protein